MNRKFLSYVVIMCTVATVLIMVFSKEIYVYACVNHKKNFEIENGVKNKVSNQNYNAYEYSQNKKKLSHEEKNNLNEKNKLCERKEQNVVSQTHKIVKENMNHGKNTNTDSKTTESDKKNSKINFNINAENNRFKQMREKAEALNEMYSGVEKNITDNYSNQDYYKNCDDSLIKTDKNAFHEVEDWQVQSCFFKVETSEIEDDLSLKEKFTLLKVAKKLSSEEYESVNHYLNLRNEKKGVLNAIVLLKNKLPSEDYLKVRSIADRFLNMDMVEDVIY